MSEAFELIKPFLAPLATAGVGAIGIVLQDRRHSHDAHFQEHRARAEASERVAFINQWLLTQQIVCSPDEFQTLKALTRSQLDQIYDLMFTNISDAQRSTAIAEHYPLIRRALLLYRPPGIGGWIFHLIFYTLLVITLLSTWGIVLPPVTHLQEALEIIVPLVGAMLVVRGLAVGIETRRLRAQMK